MFAQQLERGLRLTEVSLRQLRFPEDQVTPNHEFVGRRGRRRLLKHAVRFLQQRCRPRPFPQPAQGRGFADARRQAFSRIRTVSDQIGKNIGGCLVICILKMRLGNQVKVLVPVPAGQVPVRGQQPDGIGKAV